jgi:O-succinylbenzoic acid--CoA ligase
MSNFNSIHNSFRLNGNSFSSQKELLEFAKKHSSNTFSFLVEWFNNATFITVNTSGSTGVPKSIQLKKEHMINSASTTGAYFILPENTTALLCLSTEFIAGKMMLVRALILGWHLDIVEPSSKPLIGVSKQYDFCAMVPMQLNNSIDQLHLIKKLIVGGGAVSRSLKQKIEQLKTKIFATYGMTETITHIAIKKLNHILHAERDSASYYNVLPNIKIFKDNKGCLVIDAPKISDHQISTNDLIELISESEFKWLGRYDNIINSGSVKLIPEQIEIKLSTVIDQRFFVAGISDNILGEKLILVIESKKMNNVIMNKVKNLTSLSKFEIPKELFFIEKFIDTDTKKIQRKETLDKLFKS